jgi:acyl-CoA thioester hydrolase
MNDEAGKLLVQVPIAVRWRDMDAFNHVNNAVYATYLEEARLRWLERIPGDWFDASESPMVVAQTINYRAPISWPAEIEVILRAGRIGNTSLTLTVEVLDARSAVHYADGNTVMVWIDRRSGRPVPLPKAIRDCVS